MRASPSKTSSELVRSILKSCDLHKDRAAVVSDGQFLTYRELRRKSERIRRALHRHAIDFSRPVIIDQSSPLDTLIAMTGVLSAGGIYTFLPLSSTPDERSMLTHELGSNWILRDPENAADLREPITTSIGLCRLPHDPPPPSTPTTVPAAIYFTSGTTGRQRGVPLSGQILQSEAMRQITELSITPEDRLGLLFNPAFSASISAVYATLLSGAALHVYPTDHAVRPEMAAIWLSEERITLCDFTTTLFRHVCRQLGLKQRPLYLRLVSAGAEKVTEDDFRRFKTIFAPHCQFQITLASTETRVSTQLLLTASEEWPGKGSLPLGSAVDGKEIIIMNEHRVPVEGPRSGYIAIRGSTIASEYWNDAETSDRFFERDDDGVVTFYSRDMGHLSEDGQLFFEGRDDDIMNIRGQKFSFTSIEDQLSRLWGFDTVLVCQDQTLNITAFYEGHPLTERERHSCIESAVNFISKGIIPTALVHVEQFPRTPNGKIDRKKLAHMTPILTGNTQGALVDNAAGKILAFIRSLLHQPKIHPDDSFFAAGGDSLASEELLVWIEKKFDHTLTIEQLIMHPSANEISGQLKSGSTGSYFFQIESSSAGGRLILVPGMFGTITPLLPLASGLKQHASSWGIHYGKYETGENYSVEERAAHLISQVTWTSLPRPTILCGYSFGGLVAFEMARQLRKAGTPVDDVWLVDASPPISAATASTGKPASGRIWSEAIRSKTDPAGYARLQLFRLKYRLTKAGLLPMNNVDERRRERIMLTHSVSGYHPTRYPGRITLFLASDATDDVMATEKGWAVFADGGLRVRACSGNHQELIHRPHRDTLLALMKETIEEMPVKARPAIR